MRQDYLNNLFFPFGGFLIALFYLHTSISAAETVEDDTHPIEHELFTIESDGIDRELFREVFSHYGASLLSLKIKENLNRRMAQPGPFLSPKPISRVSRMV